MAYTLSPKPEVGAVIDWVLAPASLVGCLPLINGEVAFAGTPPVATTLEYVTQAAGDENTFKANTFGITTRQSYGVNMNGGGVEGARGVFMSTAALATMDPHRRTIAWAQRTLSELNTSAFSNRDSGTLTHFTVQVPGSPAIDPDPIIRLNFGTRTSPPTSGADGLSATAPSTLIGVWHSYMVSWSDGTGTDPAIGMAIWCDGVLLASQGTHINPLSPGGPPDTITMEGPAGGNAPDADYEYWYEFNEFIPSGNDLAQKLWVNPYYFFGRRGGPRAWAYCDESMLMGAA